MTNYYPLIARAVEELGRSTGEARQSLYERTRNAVAQLRSNPAFLEADIAKECLALEEAIRKVEAEATRNSPEETCADPRSAVPSEGITDGTKFNPATAVSRLHRTKMIRRRFSRAGEYQYSCTPRRTTATTQMFRPSRSAPCTDRFYARSCFGSGIRF